jgi:DNA-binding MarR family transcriptional regulator
MSVRLEFGAMNDVVTKQVASSASSATELPSWTFLTNHGHVLVCIAQNPEARLVEMARLVGISERAVHRIVHDLIDEGFVTSARVGRRSVYQLRLDRHLRHPLEAQHRLRDVFGALTKAT